MMPPLELAPLLHGGDLAAARALFPGASEPFLDLSTGINPNPYPVGQLPAEAFTRLPQQDALARLARIAAEAYGAPSPAYVVVAPGSQIVMTQLAGLVAKGRAMVLGPTYAEHARAAALAGHEVVAADEVEQLGDAAFAVVVNPNNPDGRLVARDALLTLAERLRRHDGLLVADEAFMEVGPEAASLGRAVGGGNFVVLRSFGKFYGLPGLRLSFALAAPEIADRLAAALGPWPVSGVALVVGAEALSDRDWRKATRASLDTAARRLDALLAAAGLDIVGGTALFRLVRTSDAEQIFRRLGGRGVLVRRFELQPEWLRFGLPGSDAEWQRLAAALGR
jgi:cobalamin biosynthetic protein CobC